jgi:RsiW-degrading membrane proteinase PrsW (M82 family)
MDAFDAALGPKRPSRTALGFVVMGLLGLLGLAITLAAAGTVPFAISLVLAVLPVPLLVVAVLALDRLEPEPTRNLVFAFLWGATVAALFAGIVNSLGLSAVAAVIGPEAAMPVYATFGASFVEESLKGLLLVWFLLFRRQELDGPTDGIVYATMVGLGFAFTENIDYYLLALLQGGTSDLAFTFVLRGVFSPFLHPLFTSMTGMALGYAAIQRSLFVRVVLPLIGLAAAVTLHAIWNGAASFGLGSLLLVYIGVIVPALAMIVGVTRIDRVRMARLTTRLLPQVVPPGLVTEQDLASLSALADRRADRRTAHNQDGREVDKWTRLFQRAATELVLAHDRVIRGVADPGWIDERRAQLLPVLLEAKKRLYAMSSPRAGNQASL